MEKVLVVSPSTVMRKRSTTLVLVRSPTISQCVSQQNGLYYVLNPDDTRAWERQQADKLLIGHDRLLVVKASRLLMTRPLSRPRKPQGKENNFGEKKRTFAFIEAGRICVQSTPRT